MPVPRIASIGHRTIAAITMQYFAEVKIIQAPKVSEEDAHLDYLPLGFATLLILLVVYLMSR